MPRESLGNIPRRVIDTAKYPLQTGREVFSSVKNPAGRAARSAGKVGIIAGLTTLLVVSGKETKENWDGWQSKQKQIEQLPGWLRYDTDAPILRLEDSISSLGSPSSWRVPDDYKSYEDWDTATSRYPNAKAARNELSLAAEYFPKNDPIAVEIVATIDKLPNDKAVRTVDGNFVNDKTFDANKVEIAQIIDQIEPLKDSPQAIAAGELKDKKHEKAVHAWLLGLTTVVDFGALSIAGVRRFTKHIRGKATST